MYSLALSVLTFLYIFFSTDGELVLSALICLAYALNDRRSIYTDAVGFVAIIYILLHPELTSLAALMAVGLRGGNKFFTAPTLIALPRGVYDAVFVVTVAFASYMTEEYFKLKDILKEREKIEIRNRVSYTEEKRIRALNAEHMKRLAILNERDRISTQLHHVIGHTVTSAILQVGAIDVVNSDESIKPLLGELNNTLESGMHEIRSVLHNIKDDAINFEKEFEEMKERLSIKGMSFEFEFHDKYITGERRLDIMNLLKEAETNFIRHSSGNKFRVYVNSHPGFDVVEYGDNGDADDIIHFGIGMRFIEETVKKYSGSYNIDTQNGFKLHLTLMR